MFDKRPIPSIREEIGKLDEVERKEFGPIKQALLEEVKEATLTNASKVQNPSFPMDKEIRAAEEVTGIILGKGQGFPIPKFNLGLTGHYKTAGGDAGPLFSISHLQPEDVDKIFNSLAEKFDVKTVSALRKKMERDAAEKELKMDRSPDRKATLKAFLDNLK